MKKKNENGNRDRKPSDTGRKTYSGKKSYPDSRRFSGDSGLTYPDDRRKDIGRSSEHSSYGNKAYRNGKPSAPARQNGQTVALSSDNRDGHGKDNRPERKFVNGSDGRSKPYISSKPYLSDKKPYGDRKSPRTSDRQSGSRPYTDYTHREITDERKSRHPAAVSAEEKQSFIPQKQIDPELTEDSDFDGDGIHGNYENGAVIGRSAVRELFKAERPVDKLLVQRGERTGSIVVLVAQAIDRGIPVIETEKSKLDAIAGYTPHQGVIALAAEKEYCTVEDILQIAKDRGETPLIVICDGVTDPYNLGAIIRSAECCGAHGLIIPKRRAAGLTPLVSKASAGAIEHLAIAKVANIASTIGILKELGIWTFAAEAGSTSLYDTDFSGPCAIVMGSEGSGVSPIVRKCCDATVSIPMYGKVNSFNVSTAAGILLTEAARKHHTQN